MQVPQYLSRGQYPLIFIRCGLYIDLIFEIFNAADIMAFIASIYSDILGFSAITVLSILPIK